MKASQPRLALTDLGSGSVRLEVYGEIGPEWAGMIDVKSVARLLGPHGQAKAIELRINSPGGSAFEGVAIHNLLKSHPAKVTTVVDGVALSAASVIAMAGDTVRMPANALMMIHNPACMAFGEEDDLLKAAEMLVKVKQSCITTYAAKSGQTPETLAAWMNEETWFTAEEAIEAGLADETDGAADGQTEELAIAAAADPQNLQFRRPPAAFLAAAMAWKPQGPFPRTAPPTPETDPVTDPKNKPANPPADPPADPPKPAGEGVVLTVDMLSREDLDRIRDEAAQAEMKRQSDIRALCTAAGMSDKADAWCTDRKFSPADVKDQLFSAMCKRNPSPDDDPAADPGMSGKDPDAALKAEYAADREVYQRQGVSEEQYVASRKRDESGGRFAK